MTHIFKKNKKVKIFPRLPKYFKPDYRLKPVQFDLTVLETMLTKDEAWFQRYGTFFSTKDGGYIYKNNGSNILGIAHLDGAILQDAKFIYISNATYEKQSTHVCFHNQFDDRLGAYYLLHQLPSMLGGVKFDWLLTTNEEWGQSTAKDFVLPEGKTYDWMVQFDRRGSEAVMYEYQSPEFKQEVAKYIPVTEGSYTCIRELQHVGCRGVNWGTGYLYEHTKSHVFIMEQGAFVLNAFINFYHANKDTLWHFEPRKFVKDDYSNWGYSGYSARYLAYQSNKNESCPRCIEKRKDHNTKLLFYYHEDGKPKHYCKRCLHELGVKDSDIYSWADTKYNKNILISSRNETTGEIYAPSNPVNSLSIRTDADPFLRCDECGRNNATLWSDLVKSQTSETQYIINLCSNCFVDRHNLSANQVDVIKSMLTAKCDVCEMETTQLFEVYNIWVCANCKYRMEEDSEFDGIIPIEDDDVFQQALERLRLPANVDSIDVENYCSHCEKLVAKSSMHSYWGMRGTYLGELCTACWENWLDEDTEIEG